MSEIVTYLFSASQPTLQSKWRGSPEPALALRIESEFWMIISHVVELILAFLVPVISPSRISLLILRYQAEEEDSTRDATHQKHSK